tara:strand:+ start:70 stop:255 length:186 start_codon:yes stop_codon:yes gene_type:complete
VGIAPAGIGIPARKSVESAILDIAKKRRKRWLGRDSNANADAIAKKLKAHIRKLEMCGRWF